MTHYTHRIGYSGVVTLLIWLSAGLLMSALWLDQACGSLDWR